MASEKPGSSVGCCVLKIAAVLGVIALIAGAGVAVMMWRAYSWVEQMPEAAPANHPPLVISEGEREDVNRVKLNLQTAQPDQTILDETVTPIVLNGVIDAVLAEMRAQNKNVQAQTVRAGFDGELMKVEATWKVVDKQGQQKYLNFLATFDLEIEEGKITKLELHKFAAAGREAPMLVRFVINQTLRAFKEGINSKKTPEAKKLEVVKLLRRESGDRLHVILDKTKFQQQTKDSPDADHEDTAAKNEGPVDAEK